MFSYIKNNSSQSICLNGNTVVVNGVRHSSIKEIILIDTNNFETNIGKYGSITIQVEGNVSSLSSASADVVVNGSVGSVSTASGDVECHDVGGNINTMSGDVDCGKVSGNISTMSGKIKNK